MFRFPLLILSLLLPLILAACNRVPHDGVGYSESSAKDAFVPSEGYAPSREIGLWTERQPYHQGIPALQLDGSHFVVATGPSRGYSGRYTWRDDSLLILEGERTARSSATPYAVGRLRMAGDDRLVVTGLALDPDNPVRTEFILYRARTNPLPPGY